MSTYILVDFASLAHRCKHIGAPDVVTKTGMALHITLNSLRQVWRNFGGSHVVLCLEGKSWRRGVYPQYKAQRRMNDAQRSKREIEDDEFYFEAMNRFVSFLKERTNVTVLQSPVAEADDFIARWIQLHPTDTNIIFSGDTDFYQLLNDNVVIYDGVKGWTISSSQVLDEKGKPAITKKNVKVKNDKGILISKTVTTPVSPPVAEYELFKKIIRGDSSDNIMSACPGAREQGSAKKPGILEAYNDRHNKGYEWNQFMLQEWDKLEGSDEDGIPIMKTVRVIDEYKINKQLIDLTQQPDEIKTLLDQVIIQQVQKKPQQGVGIWFLRFAEEMALNNIVKFPTDYAVILATPYIKN